MDIIEILENIASAGIRFVLPFLLAYLALKILNRVIDRALGFDQTGLKGNLAIAVVRSLITVLIWSVAVFAAMHNIPGFSQTWTTVLTSASVASVVLGLAAQDTLSNVFAGISMSIGSSKPFSIGDRVQIGDADPGYVEAFTLRHVELVNFQQEHIYIPNSVVASARVVNYSLTENYSQWMSISVAYESNLDQAMDIIAEVVAAHPDSKGTDRPPVFCKEAGESGILLQTIVTTARFEDNLRVRSDCLRTIMKRFVAEGIEIPYNKLVVLQNNDQRNA